MGDGVDTVNTSLGVTQQKFSCMQRDRRSDTFAGVDVQFNERHPIADSGSDDHRSTRMIAMENLVRHVVLALCVRTIWTSA